MRFWIALFIILLVLLDILWMLDGFLNVQYGSLLSQDSYLNSTTTLAVRLFGDKPLVSLYYRIIISMLVIISGILISIGIQRISHYRDQLHASSQKYKLLFMEMKTGFALRRISRDEEGNIKEIRFIEENPAFRLLTGLDNNELKGRTVAEVFGNANGDLIKEYDRIARYGGSFTRIHHTRDNKRILRITAYQHEEDVFATLVDDITREKKTEEELIESSQLKSILLDTVSEGIAYLDKEMKVIWANKKAEELILEDTEEIIGRKCHELWCGNSKNRHNCPALRTLTSYVAEKDEYTNPNGRYLQIVSNPIFSADKMIKGVVITLNDLTEWKNSLEDLQRQQLHLNLALEAGQMTAWQWDAANNEIILEQPIAINSEAKNTWQLKDLNRYINKHDGEEFRRQKDEILQGIRKEMQVEVRFISPARKWTWFNLIGRIKETDINGKPVRMIGITYNIDQFKKTTSKLKKTNEELTTLKEKLEKEVSVRLNELREKDLLMIRQSRQAAMGEMIGNIAHQWRQPLNSVAVIIQDLIDAWDFGELTRDYIIEKVNLGMSIINHMSNTIDDFRDFFSPDNQPMEFRLDEQVIKTINILKDMYSNQGIKIDTELEAVTITSFAREFSQVLINILNNAKDVLIDRNVPDALVKVKLKTTNDKIVLSISDNAGGIPENIIDKIFDPYFTTKQSSNGTGVGLYMSKNIIEKHIKGRLVTSNIDDGAEFTITLDKKTN
ncbi:MAG: PAS domain-containing protein [Candidatus Cloacimonetes bacterium]|nr:PAS domain-containing protein [Candidatus Cloacimonadota bacterium]